MSAMVIARSSCLVSAVGFALVGAVVLATVPEHFGCMATFCFVRISRPSPIARARDGCGTELRRIGGSHVRRLLRDALSSLFNRRLHSATATSGDTMGNFTASIIVYVLTVVAFMLAVLVQQYHLYLFSSELADIGGSRRRRWHFRPCDVCAGGGVT